MMPSTVRIFVCTSPTDMRASFDRLALAARDHFGEDPLGGSIFVFINKRANRIKALWFDRNGYCILYKRAHRAVFPPPRSTDKQRAIARVDARELARLFAGVDKQPTPRISWHSNS